MYYRFIYLKQNPAFLFSSYGLFFDSPFILILSEGLDYYFSQTLEFITDYMIGFMVVIAYGLQVSEMRSCVWSAPSAAQALCHGLAQHRLRGLQCQKESLTNHSFGNSWGWGGNAYRLLFFIGFSFAWPFPSPPKPWLLTHFKLRLKSRRQCTQSQLQKQFHNISQQWHGRESLQLVTQHFKTGQPPTCERQGLANKKSQK